MLRSVVLATQNPHKRLELARMLAGSAITVKTLADFNKLPKVTEDRPTFEGNARKKARAYSRATRSLVLADDSGLVVKKLRGAPGVYSARFAGKGCTYHDNNRKLLRCLKNVPPSKRSAKFVCVIAIYDNGRPVAVVRGECAGRIALEEKGKRGFGYDPVFVPAGLSRTFAEIPPRRKNRLSHRGKALRRAKKVLLRYFQKV